MSLPDREREMLRGHPPILLKHPIRLLRLLEKANSGVARILLPVQAHSIKDSAVRGLHTYCDLVNTGYW